MAKVPRVRPAQEANWVGARGSRGWRTLIGRKNRSLQPHLVTESVPGPALELGGQAWQVEASPAVGVGENVFAPQEVQADAADSEKLPAAHDWQERWVVAPWTGEAVPGEHAVHVEAWPSAKVPTSHWLTVSLLL